MIWLYFDLCKISYLSSFQISVLDRKQIKSLIRSRSANTLKKTSFVINLYIFWVIPCSSIFPYVDDIETEGPMEKYGSDFSAKLGLGLADNWSQVLI